MGNLSINEYISSKNVMKRIGLKKIGEFKHPKVEENSPLKPHVLYKIEKTQYEEIKDK